MPALHIIYASTSGHTEFVIQTLAAFLKEKAPQVTVDIQRAEQATKEDLARGDVILLASGTWNTGGVEGQPNLHMVEFLEKSAGVDLSGKKMALIGLGDTRYYYTARCLEGLQQYRAASKAAQLLPPLVIVNEPYGQEDKVRVWGDKLVQAMMGK